MHQLGSVVPPWFTSCQCQSGSAGTSGAVDAENRTTDTRQPQDRHRGHPEHRGGGVEQEHRLKVLFEVLDVNGDGGICIDDLTAGLQKLGVRRTKLEVMVGERLTGVDECIYLV